MKPEIWADERVGDLSHGARLLFVGLITMADDEGRLRELPSAILGHIFPYDSVTIPKLSRWLREVAATGMVIRYEIGGKRYLAFRRWLRHQRIDRPNDSDLPPPPDHLFDDPSPNGSPNGLRSDRRSIDDRSSSFTKKDPDPDPIIENLSHRLAEAVRRNDPKSDPKPESERWLTDMRLLLADRQGDVAEVERVIDWCQRDEFWRCNVLSPAKLRKQFTQLVLKANSGDVVRPSRRESASDLLRAINNNLEAS